MERQPFDPQASGYARSPHPRAHLAEWVVTSWDGGAVSYRGVTKEEAERLAAELDAAVPNARPIEVVHGSEEPGREARCSCGNVVDSDTKLAFYEFRGEGSRWATDGCKHCGYSLVAHTATPSRTQKNVVSEGRCPGFEQRGPHRYDSFYDGCRGVGLMKTVEYVDQHGETLSYEVLETKEDADEQVTDAQIQDCLEGWFGDRRTVPEQEFIDRLVTDTGYEIENYDDPAAKRLLSRARKIKKELND